MARDLNAANVAAEKPPAPAKNSSAWDALMLNLCAIRAEIEADAAGQNELIKKRKMTLKAQVIDAQSTMGAFDFLYDLWKAKNKAEESGDDSVLRERLDSQNEAWRVLELGTQATFAGLDNDGFATAEQDKAELAAAADAGAEYGAQGYNLIDATFQWDHGAASKRVKKAFEDAWSIAFANRRDEKDLADRPKRRRGRPPKSVAATVKDFDAPGATAEPHAAAPEVATGEEARKLAAACVGEADLRQGLVNATSPGAYAFGERGRAQGYPLEEVLAHAGAHATVEQKTMIQAGWEDQHETIMASLAAEPVAEDAAAEY